MKIHTMTHIGHLLQGSLFIFLAVPSRVVDMGEAVVKMFLETPETENLQTLSNEKKHLQIFKSCFRC